MPINTLSEYYKQLDKPIPSIGERAKIYEEKGLGEAGIYAGTAEQNIRLLNVLQAPETEETTADLLKEGRDMRTPGELAPDTGTVMDLTAEYTPERAAKFFEEQAAAYKAELEEARKTRAETAEKQKTWWEKVTGREAKLETERERWELPETFEQIKTLQTEAGVIRENIINLQQQREDRKIVAEGKTQSMVAIQGEQALIDRAYNSRIAAESARLSAKSAMINSLQGNMEMARQLSSETVNAMIYDQEREYRMLQDTYNLNQDLISDLGADYDAAFKNAVNAAETKYNEAKAEKENIMKLQLSAATDYGIELDLMGMSLEDATKAYNERVAPLVRAERARRLAVPTPTPVPIEGVVGEPYSELRAVATQYLQAPEDERDRYVPTGYDMPKFWAEVDWIQSQEGMLEAKDKGVIQQEFLSDKGGGMPLDSALELYKIDLGEGWIKEQYKTAVGAAGKPFLQKALEWTTAPWTWGARLLLGK